MSEFLLELYSEEMPPNLQINAREELAEKLNKFLIEENIKFKSLQSLSTPTRLVIIIKGLTETIKIPAREIKGPKVGVLEDIKNSFLKAHNSNSKDLFEKQTEKGKFYFIKTFPREIQVQEILKKIVLNSLASIKWKKSMRWSDNDLLWGRPLRSMLSLFNGKILSFNYAHLKANDFSIIEKDADIKSKKFEILLITKNG